MDLSRDEEGATQDRSNAPITTTNDPEQVRYIGPEIIVLLDSVISYLSSFRSAKRNAVASSREK